MREAEEQRIADLRRRQLGHASYSQTTEYTLYDVDDIRLDIVSPVSLLKTGSSTIVELSASTHTSR